MSVGPGAAALFAFAALLAGFHPADAREAQPAPSPAPQATATPEPSPTPEPSVAPPAATPEETAGPEAAPSPSPAPSPGPVPTGPQRQVPSPAIPQDYVEEKIRLPLFGRVKVYRPEPLRRTRGVVLFVSGDGGWKLGVVEMARRTADRSIVVGLSMPAWRKVAEKSRDKCWFPAGDLESIAQAVEKIYKLPRYLKPILVGFSSGATTIYGALAQAPGATFAGAVSLGFCPDIEVNRPWCVHGDWKPSFDPQKKTSVLPRYLELEPRPDGVPRWTILQGRVDKVCAPGTAAGFAEAIPAARLISLPKVGHGFSVARNWGEAYDRAIEALLEPRTPWEPLPDEARHAVPEQAPGEIRQRLEALDLPLEVQWPGGATAALIFVSGDGGWAELDQRVASGLAARGVAVVGWNTLRYFWEPKTPFRFRADLARVLQALPEEARVFAGGYSFGAEVIPATIASAVPVRGEPLSRILGLVLIAPGPYAAFEVSPLDWLRSSEPETEHSVRKSIAALVGLPILCLEPSDGAVSGCPDDGARGVTRVVLPGGHHFAGDYGSLVSRILSFLAPAGAPSPPAAPEN